MKGYIVKIEKDGTGYMASFPDVPEALTGADTYQEALKQAQDALFTAIQGYMEGRIAVPVPRAKDGDAVIYLPETMEAKVLLWNAMLKEKVSKTEMAKRLGKTEGYVRKLLDPYQNVTINSLAEAAHVLKKRIAMEMVVA
ncbi:MAG: type II toxin-antitoxin system HicB family antitoxin [Pseudomonadota bacterium]